MASLLERLHGAKVLYDKAPWLVLGIVVGLSAAFMLLGRFLEPQDARIADLALLTRLGIHVGQLAQICLLGGIVAAITRMFALTGFFREALSEIVESRLGDFESKVRNILDLAVLRDRATGAGNLEELWQEVSRRVLLPGF